MVLNKLIFTVADDGDASHGEKASALSVKEKNAKSATPTTSEAGTPVLGSDPGKGKSSSLGGARSPHTSDHASGAALRHTENTNKPVAGESSRELPGSVTPLLKTTPKKHDVIETIELDPVAQAIRTIEAEEETSGIVLDPKDSERQYYKDPYTALQREIWRPGDGDGDKKADYYDKIGPAPPLGKRWRFYQSRTGSGPVKLGINEPPKYVILDDRAAYEVFSSDIHRSKLDQWWSHDFGGGGKVRHRRPHRGRGAIGDPDAEGEHRYHFTNVGVKKDKYYFTGGKDYKPVIYRSSEPEQLQKRKATSPPSANQPTPKKHANQHTAKHKLVKYGGMRSRNPERYRPRINAFLRRDPSPEVVGLDKTKLYGLEPHHPTPSVFAPAQRLYASTSDADEGENIWMEPDDARARRKLQKQQAYAPVHPAAAGEDNEKEESPNRELFPVPVHAQTKPIDLLDSSPEPETEEITTTRQKLPPVKDFFATMNGQLHHSFVSSGSMARPSFDSGSYATMLEQRLEDAKNVDVKQKLRIEKLETDLAAARKKIGELEAVTAQACGYKKFEIEDQNE